MDFRGIVMTSVDYDFKLGEDRLNSLLDQIDSITVADDISKTLLDAKQRYGLNHIVYIGLSIPKLTVDEPYIAVTYPQEWIEHYKRERFIEVDPVLNQGLKSILPMDWQQLEKTTRKVKQLFDDAADFKIGSQGISIPIRGRHGDLALLSLTSDLSPLEWRNFKLAYMRDFQVLAVHIHQSVLRANDAEIEETPLSRRELECLYWAACGKTADEIALILKLTRRGVRFHLSNVIFKLNVVNVTQAAAKASAYEMINNLR